MRRRVLAVDDDDAVLDILTDMLEDLGCDVLRARSGAEALHLLISRNVEIMITDVNMPDMDGLELALRAKQQKTDLRVLLVSGREAEGREFPILRKPFTQDDLRQTMRRTTGSR